MSAPDKLVQALRRLCAVLPSGPRALAVYFARDELIAARQALAAHEAEKQAGPVAGQASAPAPGADVPSAWLAQFRIAQGWHDGEAFVLESKAQAEAAKYSKGRVIPLYERAAPPSESNKTDADLLRAASQALACMRGLQQHLGSAVCSVEADSLDRAIRATQAQEASR